METPAKINVEDFIRSALMTPELVIKPEQVKKLCGIIFLNATGDFPYDIVLQGFIHRLNGDDAAIENYKGTPFETVVDMLPVLSKKTTEFQAAQGQEIGDQSPK